MSTVYPKLDKGWKLQKNNQPAVHKVVYSEILHYFETELFVRQRKFRPEICLWGNQQTNIFAMVEEHDLINNLRLV